MTGRGRRTRIRRLMVRRKRTTTTIMISMMMRTCHGCTVTWGYSRSL